MTNNQHIHLFSTEYYYFYQKTLFQSRMKFVDAASAEQRQHHFGKILLLASRSSIVVGRSLSVMVSGEAERNSYNKPFEICSMEGNRRACTFPFAIWNRATILVDQAIAKRKGSNALAAEPTGRNKHTTSHH